MRDYEVVKVEQEVPNEFLLVFDDGGSSSPTTTNGLKDSEARRAGAYYKLIERKMLLKKKRTEVRNRPFGGRDFAHIKRFSRSNASATSGPSCASRMYHRARRKPKNAPRRSRRYAIRCICCIRPMQKARTISTSTVRLMRMQMEKANWSSARQGNYSVYSI